MTVLALCLSLVCGPHKWTAPQLALGAAWLVGQDIDRATSVEALHRGYVELNPIIGQHPTEAQINDYAALWAVGAGTIAILLDGKWRTAFLIGANISKWLAVRHQLSIGLHLSF